MTYKRALHRGRFFCFAFVSIFGLVIFGSCSSAHPEIMQVEARIIVSAPEFQERLSLFVEGNDPDGIDDISWMVVEYPDLFLGWRIEEETLVRFNDEGQYWFGSDTISLPQGDTLPRGRLTVILGDLSGRTDARELTLPPLREAITERSFPRIVFAQDGDAWESAVLETAFPEDRHFIRTDDAHWELVLPGENGTMTPGEVVEFPLSRDLVSRVGDQPYWIIREHNSQLWLEWGPVTGK